MKHFERIATIREEVQARGWSSLFHEILPRINKYIARLEQDRESVSQYWQKEILAFDYLFDASPLVLANIRHHCFHITGEHQYSYRIGSINFENLKKRWDQLRSFDQVGLKISDTSKLGGFGYELDGAIVNVDVLKFYEVILTLQKASIISSQVEDQVICEIGSGWGGLIFQLVNNFPNLKFVIVDLPHTLIFSTFFLTASFPDRKAIFFDDPNFQSDLQNCRFDFAFIPSYATGEIRGINITTAINIASFQEMTTAQVEEYARWLTLNNCQNILSLNRDKSPHNSQLESVHDALISHFDLVRSDLLPDPYTVVGKKTKKKSKEISVSEKRQNIASKVKRKKNPNKEKSTYTTLVGTRK